MSEEKKDNGSIVTPVFRLAFPAVFEKTRNRNNSEDFKPQYEITMLFPKPGNDKARKEMELAGVPKALIDASFDLTALRKIMADAARKKFGEKLNDAAFRKQMANPIRDADEEGKATEGYGGHFFIKASNKRSQPVVIGQSGFGQRVTDSSRVYGGMYCRACVNAFGWTFGNMKKGVSFGLQHVQLVCDHMSFVGLADPDKVFDQLEAESGGKDDAAMYVGGTAGDANPFKQV